MPAAIPSVDPSAPAPAAEPLRSSALVTAVVGLPAAVYAAVAVVPWVRGTFVEHDGGNGWALLATTFLFLGAMVGLAAAGTALLTRGDRRTTWVVLTVASAAVLAWLVSPAGNALTTAALD